MAARMTTRVRLTKLAMAGHDMRPWYDNVRSEISLASTQLRCEPKRIADLLAIFSPRVSVFRCVRWTVHYIRTGEFMHDVTRSTKAAVRHYEATGEIRGVKTGPFARALLNDDNAVVLDTWMAVAFNVDPKHIGDKPAVRKAMERSVRAVASTLGWRVVETQAAIWAAIVRGQGPYAVARTMNLMEEVNAGRQVACSR